jgi:tRNA uridine 5-carboxymethylaminomethyl modification enzyme
MSCNPAIGGLGKGHLVREIDALDGLMARAADRAGIQFRLLNRRKGPAVQGPRTQADRAFYRVAVQEMIAGEPLIEVIEAEVTRLTVNGGVAQGVVFSDGAAISAPSIVLTAGTFLNGVIHVGDQNRPGGRVGDAPSVILAMQLGDLALARGRLKTGTPPRLDGRTIDWDKLESQPGDDEPVMFSFLNKAPVARQISCGITHTNEETHEVVRQNLHRSAMYGGHIEGIGPRYCPSIEDKVVRFADKSSHQVFLEPEGLDDNTVYPNGISTSLPAEVQADYVRTIVGLENAVITQPGYAIEYDFFDPRGLDLSLMLKSLPGLFLAGQINGTTGYEEAAAQGLAAGLNAAARAKSAAPITFSRTESYIGVMIDDLVARGVTEPYRMFTSRAEFRLTLRADNADQRLTPIGIALGCVRETRQKLFETKLARITSARELMESTLLSSKSLVAAGIQVAADGARRSAYRLLALADISREQVDALVPAIIDLEPEIRAQVERDALYEQYLGRQTSEAEALRREEAALIPNELQFSGLPGLSAELAAKLQKHRPATLAHAAKIEGMTPAALVLILAHVKRVRRGAAA